MRHILLIFIAILLITACGPQAGRPGTATDIAETARTMLAAGDYLAAADEYFRLAKIHRNSRDLYTLRAAGALLDALETDLAEETVNTVRPGKKDQQSAYLKLVLQGRIALQRNDPDRALEILSREPEGRVADDILAQRHLARARSRELLSQYLQAVMERLVYENYISDYDLLVSNTVNLWTAVNKIDTDTLRELRNNSPRELLSWIDLALINQTLVSSPAILRKSLAAWQEEYPVHNAIPLITGRLLEFSEQYEMKPGQIALLLPLTGQYQKAAEAIRDGLVSAWYDSPDYQPLLRIYNAASLNIREVYNRAVADGADFVIGPLEKSAIVNLTASGDLPVVTLALNHAGTGSENTVAGGKFPKLIQFGLSPEDEARQAAERSFFDGHNKALVLTPDNDWGRRIAEAFRQTWLDTGGRVLESISFSTDSRDFSTPVKRLLNVDSSEFRAKKLRQLLNRKLESEARLREDTDMIFLAAQPLYARQLVPQFRFHKAETIPIYSTSHIFSGNINPQVDMDMEGVRFSDMPWILEADGSNREIRKVIERNWRTGQSPYRRLYALGVDAFNIIPHLSKLVFQENTSFSGHTGILSISPNGRIHRKLLWGMIRQGRPYLIDN